MDDDALNALGLTVGAATDTYSEAILIVCVMETQLMFDAHLSWMRTQMQSRRKYIRLSAFMYGIPMAALLIWAFDDWRAWSLGAALVLLALVGGWLWGAVMWEAYFKHVKLKDEPPT